MRNESAGNGNGCCATRRQLLRVGARALVGLAAGAAVPSCRKVPPAAGGPPPVSIPLAKLPPGERVTMTVRDHPVELLRTDSQVVARSLLCTHFGCEVFWVPEDGTYHCPCHDGRFDAEGRVVSGPPPRPLSTLTATVRGDVVLVGG